MSNKGENVMSLSNLLMGLFFVLYGLQQLGIIAVSATVMGVIALIVGILILISAFHPITVFDRRP